MVKQQEISLIACIAQNGAIGFHNHLLYPIMQDMQRFKTLTTGHTIVMGRKTFESLPKGALPNRRNVVVTRNEYFTAPGIEVFHSLEAAFDSCRADEEVFVIGGESVYRESLPRASRLCLTHIHAVPAEADTFFPEYNADEWTLESSEAHEPDEKNTLPFTFANYKRK